MPYKDPEKAKEAKKRWRENNAAKIKIDDAKYRASERGKEVLAKIAAKNKAKRDEYNSSPEGIAKKEAREKWNDGKDERKKIAARKWYSARRARDIASGKIVPKRRKRLTPDERKEAKAVARKNRKAREKAAKGKLSRGIRKVLYAAQKGKCPVCKSKLIIDGDKKYHIDHVVPLSAGGMNTDDNVQLLCFECNVSKGAKPSHVFMQSRGFLL